MRLKNSIRTLGDYPVIIGSDWNCTFATDPIDTNIDCYNMQNVPNLRHSNIVSDLCTELEATDPFRYLWPNRSDFSYISKNTLNKNRSRIDFFLISNTLLTQLKKCFINPSLASSSFDHKPIFAVFRPQKTNKLRKLRINQQILSDPDINIVVTLAVIETYAHHILPVGIEVAFNNRNPLNVIGRLWGLLRSAGPSPTILPPEKVTDELITNRNTLLNNLNIELQTFDLNLIQNSDLSCEDDIFLEILLNNIRNEVTGYQHFIYKTKTGLKSDLLKDYEILKNSQDPDNQKLSSIESRLDLLSESEITDDLRKYNIFDILNQEKITPAFLQLAKIGQKEASLDEVCNETGEQFPTPEERNSYITDYYRNVYSPKPRPLIYRPLKNF